MIIELSPKKIVPGAITVWNEHGPEVDIVMDLKRLTFKEGSIDELYAFRVLDHLFLEEIPQALENWHKCVASDKQLFVVVDNYETISRSFVGGDISVEKINTEFAHPVQFTQDSLIAALRAVGFTEENISIWYQDVPGKFKKGEFDLVMASKK